MQTNERVESATLKEARNFFGITGALFAPVFVTFAWLWVSGKEHYQIGFGTIVIYVALAIGFACTFLLPMRWYWRIVLLLLYVPVQFWVVFLFGISYVCGAYGNCL